VVSHDQDFLNSISTDIIHVYEQKLIYYRGNYDNFKHAFTESVSLRRKQYEKQVKLLKEAQRQKKGQTKGDSTKKVDKAKQNIKVIRNKNLGKDKGAKGKGKKGDEEDVATDNAKPAPPPKDYTVCFEFPDPPPLAIPIIQVDDASFGYEPQHLLFKNLNFGVDMESRIALVGPNGAGKSTLIKLLQGELNATHGNVTRNRKLVIGKFTQHFVDQLEMDVSPVIYLQRHFPEFDEAALRKHLGRFGLTGMTHVMPINQLSGGQKSRVVFAELSMRNPHLLFLDEPTNHLDIESVDALAEALNEFKGGLILVSHDTRLISHVCSSLWIVKDNTVTVFDGDFDDYRTELIEEFEQKEQEEEEKRRQKEEEKRTLRQKAMQEKQRKK
jgi:ATP-binding cassette subfamily F protein 1